MNKRTTVYSFKNSTGERVHITCKHTTNMRREGTVILEHGLFSGSETEHNRAFAEMFQDLGYATLQIDATNSNNNRSGGDVSEFTIAQHTSDLMEAIDWAAQYAPGFLTKRFGIVGHSMGGLSAIQTSANAVLADLARLHDDEIP